ncbi:DUF169 domain-containing protein [Methanolobus sp. ZRKC3]|uniref:DUF169 domain-containing protein n=1 Tax=Methanolobus sp. ZRKC3 TaxID=3125786 RepID=UPI0032469076
MDLETIHKMSQELIDSLKLETSPVAVTIIPADKEIPEGIEQVENEKHHCGMIDDARRKKTIRYALLGDQKCDIGAAALGLSQKCNEIEKGDFYYYLNCFGSIDAARKTMKEMPMMPSKSAKAIVYAPLEKTPVKPSVVIIVANPETVMQISQTLLYNSGGKINTSFSGLQSFCSESVVHPMQERQVNISLGCTGSRMFTEFDKDEMIIGIPPEMLEDMVEGAKKMIF